MIDAALLPIQRRALAPLARVLAARGIGADRITLAGFAIGLAAVPALAFGSPVLALIFILANRLLDGLDGAVARLTRPSARGAFLDIALDFAFYALVPLGFAMWLAHFGFHLATGIATGIPVVQRVAQQIGWSALGTPDWSLSGAGVPASRLLPLEILALDVGLLLSLYVAWRIALSHAPRPVRALQLVAPWAVLAAVLWMLGIWVFFQPMQMRGMVM